MKYLLALLIVLVTADGLLTNSLLDGGLAREGNPLLEPLVGEFGFIALKIAGVLVCAFILWDVHRRYPRLALTATWCFVIAYAGIVLWNSSLFIRAWV